MNAIPIRPEWPVAGMLALTLVLCVILLVSAVLEGRILVAGAALASLLFGLAGLAMFYLRFIAKRTTPRGVR